MKRSTKEFGSYGNLQSMSPCQGDADDQHQTLLEEVQPCKKLCVVMVGLPARGKTAVARKLMRYLRWLGHKTSVFNVGNYRRKHFNGSFQDASFFDPENVEGRETREQLAHEALTDMLKWYSEDEGGVAIFDATNSTKDRRVQVRQMIEGAGIRLLFVEPICDDQLIVENNIRETKVSSPDYVNMDAEKAVADFRERIKKYEIRYEPLSADENVSFVKLINVGKQVMCNEISGYLASRIVYFLMNVHTIKRPIFLSRHGESLSNTAGVIGQDKDLSDRGKVYAHVLAKWCAENGPPPSEYVLWTSCLRRTKQTVKHFHKTSFQWRALNEIDAGVCDGMTYEQIKEEMPEEYESRSADKLTYRYPEGESYMDVIQRLESMVFEAERMRAPLVIVAHQAILRVLYAYFMDLEVQKIPHLDMPLHHVLKLTPMAYGCECEDIDLNDQVKNFTLPQKAVEEARDMSVSL